MTTRRDFLGMLAALVPTAWMGRRAVAAGTADDVPQPRGDVDVERWHREYGRRYRCIVNGRDVHCECFRFNADEGWADCFVTERLADGTLRRVREDGKLAKVRRHGQVRVVRAENPNAPPTKVLPSSGSFMITLPRA